MINPYTPVESKADLPQFCPTCGWPMKVEWKVKSYDPATGAPLGRSEARCTEPWWRKLGGDHQIYIVAPKPMMPKVRPG